MNPEHVESFSNIIIAYDNEVIGTAESISAEVELDTSNEDRYEIEPNKYANGFEGTFTVEYINDELIDKFTLQNKLWFYTEVIRYAKHSKKRHKAIKKLKQVIDEYKKYL